MNNFKKLRNLLKINEVRAMSGATRAYRKAVTSSWKQGGRSGELTQRASELEKKTESPVSLIHAKTMRQTAQKLRAKSGRNLDIAKRLRPVVPQTRKRNL